MSTRRLASVLFLLVTIGDFSSGEIYFKKGAPHVRLSNGLLSGSLDYSREGRPFSSFVGVPYGRIKERFEVAQPAEPWDGIFNATTAGPVCAQSFEVTGNSLFSGEEECLNLNVYVPMNNTQKNEGYPVMVWIHGGGFAIGNGFGYGPKFFMDEDVILVSINYRLSSFGFLSTGDSVIPGNNGLKDMVLALQWVQKNIKNFGGNPDLVTVYGESAGGAAVHYLMLSPSTKGLFKHAISQSGVGLAVWSYNPDPKTSAVQLATYLKCPSSANDSAKISSEEILTCLKSVSAKELSEATLKFKTHWPTGVALDFVPVKEPEDSHTPFLTKSPWSLFSENVLPNPEIGGWLIGTTENEGAFLYAGYVFQDQKLVDELNTKWNDVILNTTDLQIYLKPEDKDVVAEKIRKFYFGDKKVSTETRENLTNLYSDVWFIHSARKGAVETAKKSGTQVFLYQYAYHGPVSAIKLFGFPSAEEELKKVTHADDVIMLFNLEKLLPGAENIIAVDSEDEKFSKLIVKQWVSFAVHGKPGSKKALTGCSGSTCDDVEWDPIPKDELEGKSPLKWYKLDRDPSYFDEGPLKERVLFWETLFNDYMLHSLLGQDSSS